MRKWLTGLLCMVMYLAPAVSVRAQYTGDVSNSTTTLPDSGAVTRSVVSRLRDATFASDFCNASQSTGGANAQPCLQAATDALCARGGGLLFIPAGTYSIGDGTNDTWNIRCPGINIVGAGIGDQDIPNSVGTKIVAASAGGAKPVIVVSVPSLLRFARGFSIRDLEIYNGDMGAPRTGSFLEIDSFEQVKVDSIKIFGACSGLKVFGGIYVHVSNTYIGSYRDGCDAVLLTGGIVQNNNKATQTPNVLDVVSFTHVTTEVGNSNSSGSCYRITDRVQTVWWTNTTCETHGRAIYATCSFSTSNTRDCPGFLTLYDFEAEAFGSGTPKLIELSDIVDGFKMTDSWLRGGATPYYSDNLVSITSSNQPNAPALNVTITSNWLKFAGGSCLYIAASGQTTITGNHIYGCNQWNINGAGVELRSGYATVTGNKFCGADFLNDISWPMRGGYIQGGVDYTVWTGNVFSGGVNGQNNGCTDSVTNNNPGAGHNLVTSNVGP